MFVDSFVFERFRHRTVCRQTQDIVREQPANTESEFQVAQRRAVLGKPTRRPLRHLVHVAVLPPLRRLHDLDLRVALVLLPDVVTVLSLAVVLVAPERARTCVSELKKPYRFQDQNVCKVSTMTRHL